MQKAYVGMGMEGSIARWYEKNTQKDMDAFRQLAGRIAGMLPAGSTILEVAPGPGFLAVELAKRGFDVTGLDISATFIELAGKNVAKAGVRARLERGNASQMPFPDESFDFLVCRAAFKNFSDPVGALSEMHRVLKPGGRGLVIDLCRDTPMSEIRKYVDGLGVSMANRIFMKLVFRFGLLKRAWSKEAFEKMLRKVPFRHTEIRVIGVGVEVWLDR
jgi:ubiquinone/menaquinone biosynthesis C-methylase UbiE